VPTSDTPVKESMTIRTILSTMRNWPFRACNCVSQPFPTWKSSTPAPTGEAIRKIKTEKPDLVFLDIQMPGFDGFSVVKGVMEIDPPLFVFVTAYSEHAIRRSRPMRSITC
jgi:two-component system LytT family response regulator